jgi:hypothetical protein
MKTISLRSLVLSVGVVLLSLAAPLRGQTVTYDDPTTNYSITNGDPNGVWSYGWMPVGFGALQLFTNSFVSGIGNPHWAGWNYDFTPGIWKNLGPQVYGGYDYGNTPLSALIAATPVPRLDPARDGFTNTVSFAALTDGTYVVQFTDSLTPPISWTDASTNVLSANQLFSLTEAPTNLAGFYRSRRD